MFAFKPDYDQVRQRMEAFWACDFIDRPMVLMPMHKPPQECLPLPDRNFPDAASRWLDVAYHAETAPLHIANHYYLGETLPIIHPNLGPEILSALYGCPLHFGDYGTSWTDPILHDWSTADDLQLDWQHPYLNTLHEMTDALLEAGKDKFIVGMTDWHPGGDALAAFRDPANLAMDLIEHKAEVQKLLARLEDDYFRLYDQFYVKLRGAGQPITSWLALFADLEGPSSRYYIPSNDFSIMISKSMFDEIFLPGLRRECQFLDRSIYHLDGPGALRHLDSVLAIPKLHALQWVPGAGNEAFERWVWVYQKAQAARKAIIVYCTMGDLDLLEQTLDPRGLCIQFRDVPDPETGKAILRRLERWAREKGKR